MTHLGILVVLTLVGAAAVGAAASGWMQPAPGLRRLVAHLDRPGPAPTPSRGRLPGRLAGLAMRRLIEHPRLLPDDRRLRLVGRTAEQHVARLLTAAGVGGLGPPLLVLALTSTGRIGLGWYVPAAASLGSAALAVLAVHLTTVERAAEVRRDVRHQVSAYLDVVAMLLAGNTGYEGALEQAAHAGDGLLFVELRRRMREAGARGSSLTEALERVGRDLGLDELEQVAASASLSAAEGAPVARTLAAKCATLRAALATEQGSEARLRTSRLTTPIVGMALIFMGLVIYPALTFS